MSGECNMTMTSTTVDLTPPIGGHITLGPFFDMVSKIIFHFIHLLTGTLWLIHNQLIYSSLFGHIQESRLAAIYQMQK